MTNIIILIISLVLTGVLIILNKSITTLIKLSQKSSNTGNYKVEPSIFYSNIKIDRLMIRRRVKEHLLPEEVILKDLAIELSKGILSRSKVKRETHLQQIEERGDTYLFPGEVEYSVEIVVGIDRE